MKLFILVAFSLLSCVFGGETPRNELTCNICVDIITDIGEHDGLLIFDNDIILDEFITDETTEQQIMDFFNQICLVTFGWLV